MKEEILSVIESPKELESLYQENTKEFQQAFPDIFAQHPDSIILQVWHERLSHVDEHESEQSVGAWSYKNILLIAVLSLIAGTLFKLPINFEKIDSEWFYTRNLAGIFIVPLMTYFFFQRPHSKKAVVIILGVTMGALLYLNLLPFDYDGSSWKFHERFRSFDDAIAVAELHVPLLLWLILGVVFAGKNWRDKFGGMIFLRYNGEVIVYTTVIVIGGLILTGITLTLLSLVEESSELSNWYLENVIPYGVVAAPIVASFLIEKIIGKRFNIAPVLAKIFTPLFLLTTVGYLIVMIVYKNSPYNDREYLITFNILLIVVLGLLMFSVAERSPSAPVGLNDYINICLVLATLIIDLIALSAIIFRLSNDVYGFTPNRTAILGINLLVFCHLIGILFHYARFVSNKSSFQKLENWIAGYLPVYAIWSLTISITLPLIFWYR